MLVALLVVVGLGLLVRRLRRRWVLITVDGPSMLPTLRSGERVLVHRIPARGIRNGEIVVAELPDDGEWHSPPLPTGGAPGAGRRWMVKRTVAGPGDPVPGELAGAGVSRVPPGYFVLLGDNRRQSVDSRTFGFVPADRILGPVRGGDH